MENIFENLKPSLGPFEPIFDSWVTTLIALVWFFAFLYTLLYLIIGGARVAKARRTHQDDVEEKVAKLAWPIGAAIVLTLMPVLWQMLAEGF